MEGPRGVYLTKPSAHEQLGVGRHLEGCSLESSQGTVGTDEATKRDQMQQQKQLLPGHSKAPTARCNVCHDLEFEQAEIDNNTWVQTTKEELDGAVRRGCPTCSLISQAITRFCASLRSDYNRAKYPELHGLKQPNRVRIMPFKYLCLHLQFQKPDGGHAQVLLDLFSPRGSSAFPVLQAPDCLSSKLTLTGLATKIEAWIQNCESKHIHCHVPNRPKLPSRAIDVGFTENYDDIKLVSCGGKSARYVALSYCWGKGAGMFQTTRSSLASWIQGIPWNELPKTFQDSIIITRRLGISYLWIDALCIVQDDTHDWEVESANMASVYSNSYLTIAATAASDSHHGLFVDRWTHSSAEVGLKLPVDALRVPTSVDNPDESIFVRPWIHLAHDRFSDTENAQDHAEDAPLLTRAWAFQERLLPSRTLHVHAEELVWECKSAVQCECEHLDQTASFEAVEMEGWLKDSVTGSLHAGESAEKLGFVWLILVSEFGALHLTHESDRLAALSGLASMFSGKCLGNYLGGIWEHDLPRGLMFTVTNIELGELLPVQQIQMSPPSWSWASAYVGGSMRISYNHILDNGFVKDPHFQVIGIDLILQSGNPFSWLERGLLQLKGSCTVAKISTGPLPSGNPQFVMTVGGVQKVILLMCFWSDGNIEHLENVPLDCILIGTEDPSWIAEPGRTPWEYVLVLRKTSVDSNTYQRVGLLLTTEETCSLRNEIVRTMLLA
ncbi:heterokaryon incompatibility protein-domain-containing protein [Leptodontidium sp. MPI-SDFR-AT-0119]|nr:heterokaryon incompatibility protein-domain-containing protein [Leptodontidium sp. MPI-SDFR-AT-0119]